FLQFSHASDQLGQLLNRENLPLRLPVRLRGVTKPFLAVRDIVHDTGLCGDDRFGADFQVASQADLAGESDEISKLGASRDPGLRHQRQCSPMLTLWAIWTRLSIFVPRPIEVGPSAPRSIVVLAPISTSSRTTTKPICGTLRWAPESRT